jgi:hypothetical protein
MSYAGKVSAHKKIVTLSWTELLDLYDSIFACWHVGTSYPLLSFRADPTSNVALMNYTAMVTLLRIC